MASTLDEWMDGSKKDYSKTDIAEMLSDEAERLCESRRYREALVLINVAIENDDSNPNHYNAKAIILKHLDRYSESKSSFDKSLDIKKTPEAIKNRTLMLYDWANSLNDKKKALEIITEAIESLPLTDLEADKFWYLKGSILDCLENPVEARKCYLIAEGETEEVRKLEEQMDLIANSADSLINITGTQFYFGLDVFKSGDIVDLIAEDDNEHDPDAVRVEIGGETVGYVANSDYTLMENIKGASEIKGQITDKAQAQILFIYFETYVIAKLI